MKSEKDKLPPNEELVINSDLNALHGVPFLVLLKLDLLPHWLIELVCKTKKLAMIDDRLTTINNRKSLLQRRVHQGGWFSFFLTLGIIVFSFILLWRNPEYPGFNVNNAAAFSMIGMIFISICLLINAMHSNEHREILGDDVPVERLRVLDRLCCEADRWAESYESLYDKASDGEVVALFHKIKGCRRYDGGLTTGRFDIFSLINLSEREGKLLFHTGLMIFIYRIIEVESRNGQPDKEGREVLAEMIDTLRYLDVISKTMTVQEVYRDFFTAANKRLQRHRALSEVH